MEEYQSGYLPEAWKFYEVQELGWFVHLLVRRSYHRSPDQVEKKLKDLKDAQNYLNMMQAHIDAAVAVAENPENFPT